MASITEESALPTMEVDSLPVVEDSGPVPLSFPAFLRNPGLSSRYAHLQPTREHLARSASAPTVPRKSSRRDDNEGKRWLRRKENARFTGNPHITAPSKKDLMPSAPMKNPTFPVPLPPYLPRSVSLPSTIPPSPSPHDANAGRFSLSLKGMRRTLRKAGLQTQLLVQDVESELMMWLSEGGVIMQPGATDNTDGVEFPGRTVGGQEKIREVERTPLRLVWSIEDSWVRYVVHCCARYHEIVSFSKDTPTHRLTHLLRPNVTRPDHFARVNASLATPPATDLEVSSLASYDSDIVTAFSEESGMSDIPSESEPDADAELPANVPRGSLRVTDALSDIASSDGGAEADVEPGQGNHPSLGTNPEYSSSRDSITSLMRNAQIEADAWSVSGGSNSDAEIERGVGALSLDSPSPDVAPVQTQITDTEATPRARRTAASFRSRTAWDRVRSGSSPSRSPARRGIRRRAGQLQSPPAIIQQQRTVSILGGKRSFYDYLFD